MTIDWITVSAQMVNFLVLVWLLKRFLYEPVLSAMQRREQDILGRLQQAQERESVAQLQQQRFEQKIEQFDREIDRQRQQAHENVEIERRELIEVARDDVEQRQAVWRQQLDDEEAAFAEKLSRTCATGVLDVTRQVLGDLASVDLEAQIVDRFLAKLELSRDLLALSTQPGKAVITSTFGLDATQRDRLIDTLQVVLEADIEVTFKESARLVCGIEVNVGGQRVSWNVADYCERLQDRVSETFATAVVPES